MLAALLLAAVASAETRPPAAGASAPDFTLNSQEGKPVKLSGFRGQWVVLYFYPKDMTPGCTIEAHNFQRDLPRFEKQRAVVLGVSTQNAASHKEFCAKEDLHFKLLADVESKVSAAYGSLMDWGVAKFSARNTFLIDPDGRVAKAFLGVNPSKHSEEVLAALTSLQASRR